VNNGGDERNSVLDVDVDVDNLVVDVSVIFRFTDIGKREGDYILFHVLYIVSSSLCSIYCLLIHLT
jgi:hypothetical protein